MAIVGRITIDNILIVTVDADPSAGGGLTAPIGTIAVFPQGATAQQYLKTNTSDTSWTEQPNSPALVAAITQIQAGVAAAAGTSSSFARGDHKHNIATGAVSTQTPDQANAEGSSSNLARADHVHAIATAAASGLNAGSTNTQGAATSFARSDHTHAIASGAASGQTPNQANAAGTSTNFARADHVHNIPTAAPIAQTPDNANADGSAATFSRSDHVHNIATATASNIKANSNTQGSASSFARSDHTHQLTNGTASLDHIPQWDGSQWLETFPEYIQSMSRGWFKHEDFLAVGAGGGLLQNNNVYGDLNWSLFTAGGASGVQPNSALVDSNHMGVAQFVVGGAGGNFANLALGSLIKLGGGILNIEMLIRIEALATVTNDYSFRLGLGDSQSAADNTNGVYFEYTRGTNTNWLAKTANGGTRTSTSTGVAVASGAWIKLNISINAAASSITFSINGSSVATITTNIPTTNAVAPMVQLSRTAGTPGNVDIDYYFIAQRFTSAR